jgi:hypothetical protein
MKRQLLSRILLITVFLTVMTYTCHSQNKQADKVKMEYNYPADKPVKYLNTSKIVQNMDINGMAMQVNVSQILGCSVKSSGKQESNLKLQIVIDTLAQEIESPNGFSGGTLTEATGKAFTIIISPAGREIDLSEADKVIFNIPGSGETNATQFVTDYFPDVPTGKVKPGDTWTSSDSVNAVSKITTIKSLINSKNKFEGIENIDGIECAKISSTLSGTQIMFTQSQGMDIKTSGSFTGTSVMFFAIKEGYFIKQTVISKLNGNIEMSYPESMTIPVVMDITSVNEIQK